MQFKVVLHPKSAKELNDLQSSDQKKLLKDYEKIQSYGTDFVDIKSIDDGIFEIKTSYLRSLFAYKEDKAIIIAVIFIKKTNKTPEKYIKLAKMRLKEYE